MNTYTTIFGLFEYYSELLIFSLPINGKQTASLSSLEYNAEEGHYEYYAYDADGREFMVICHIDTAHMKEEKRFHEKYFTEEQGRRAANRFMNQFNQQ